MICSLIFFSYASFSLAKEERPPASLKSNQRRLSHYDDSSEFEGQLIYINSFIFQLKSQNDIGEEYEDYFDYDDYDDYDSDSRRISSYSDYSSYYAKLIGTKLDKSITTEVKIMESLKYNGQTFIVREIGENVFKDFTSLEKVTLPFRISIIGKESFMFCEKLKYITMPTKLRVVGESAFQGCSSLESFVLFPNDLKAILSKAFMSSKLTGVVIIPQGIMKIEDSAFAHCSKISGFSMKNQPTSKFLELKIINSNIRKIFNGNNNKNKRSIKEKQSKYLFDGEYYVIKNVLYYHKFIVKHNELIQYPIGSTRTRYNIPSNTTSVSPGAFLGSSTLQTVQIPSSLSNININTLFSSTSISNIVFESCPTISTSLKINCIITPSDCQPISGNAEQCDNIPHEKETSTYDQSWEENGGGHDGESGGGHDGENEDDHNGRNKMHNSARTIGIIVGAILVVIGIIIIIIVIIKRRKAKKANSSSSSYQETKNHCNRSSYSMSKDSYKNNNNSNGGDISYYGNQKNNNVNRRESYQAPNIETQPPVPPAPIPQYPPVDSYNQQQQQQYSMPVYPPQPSIGNGNNMQQNMYMPQNMYVPQNAYPPQNVYAPQNAYVPQSAYANNYNPQDDPKYSSNPYNLPSNNGNF